MCVVSFFFNFRKISKDSEENDEKEGEKKKVKSKPVIFIPVNRKPEIQVSKFSFNVPISQQMKSI